jgi:hypothetical protein
LRTFLAVQVRSAAVKIAEFAMRQGVPVAIDRLTHHIDIAIEKFSNTAAPSATTKT